MTPDDRVTDQGPRLYGDLAGWYPLLTPVTEYAEEAALYRRLFQDNCRRPPRTLLDLGSGAGHNAYYLKVDLACTLVDLSPDMRALSARLNPECEHVAGDMRTVRLGRAFDCVLVHDAICYMTTRADLALAIDTAFVHTEPGGVALFVPDFTAETFRSDTETGGTDAGRRGLRYLEWRWLPDPAREIYVADMAYLLRHEDGRAEAIHDRHTAGLFPRAFWLDTIARAGFEPGAVPSAEIAWPGHEVFIGRRPPRVRGHAT